MKHKRNIVFLILILIACKIGIVAMTFKDNWLTSDTNILGFAYAQSKEDKGIEKKEPNSFSINIEMMRTLNKRKEELDKKEKKVIEKKEMLQLVEQGIQAKLDEMNKIKKDIEKLIVKRDKLEEASLMHLAKIYKNMPPNDAASQLEKLDTEIAIQVFTRMKSRTSSKILPFVRPKFAKKLSEEIVKRRLIQEPEKKKKR